MGFLMVQRTQPNHVESQWTGVPPVVVGMNGLVSADHTGAPNNAAMLHGVSKALLGIELLIRAASSTVGVFRSIPARLRHALLPQRSIGAVLLAQTSVVAVSADVQVSAVLAMGECFQRLIGAAPFAFSHVPFYHGMRGTLV